MTPKNIHGPMIKKSRLDQNMSLEKLSELAVQKGLPCTPERIEKIEEQQIVLYDYQLMVLADIPHINTQKLFAC